MSSDNSASEKYLIVAKSICKRFADREILQNISLTIEPGKVVTLIGPNGAGKTTLVRILLGLLPADSGKIERKTGLRIGYMPQRVALEHTLPITVRRFLRNSRWGTEQDIDAILEELRISHLAQQQLIATSGGELQRVLLARALLGKPNLLVLDEPAQGVDLAGQAELYQLIGNICRENNCGALMISHDLNLVMSATDEVICLNHHVCCHGQPEHVTNDPAFLELFGASVSDGLAIYTHHHNHEHDLSGGIKHDE